MIVGKRDQQGRHRFGELVVEHLGIGMEHARYAIEARRGTGDLEAIPPRDQDVDRVPERLRAAQCPGRRLEQCPAIVLGKEKRRHITLASFRSNPTNSVTEATLTPAAREGGSLAVTTVSRGVSSTPSSAGVVSAMGFFLAIMMFGKDG